VRGAAPTATLAGVPMNCLPIPAFRDNYIWLLEDGRHAAVVDPGDAAPVEACLRERGLRLTTILLTHHHSDHVGGVSDLLRGRELEIVGPGAESIAHLSRAVRGAERVELAAPGLALRVLEVPGHTAGHIAYFLAGHDGEAPRLFCGDTLFSTGCGRLFEGTPAQMLASLDALAQLPGETRVHCAHEYTLSNIRFARAADPDNAALADWEAEARRLREAGQPTLPTTLAHELRVNPFLRSGAAPIQAHLAEALELGAGALDGDRLATFTALRAWKDRF
jgi:hydroxyacylglutathione hydrolase